MKLRATHSGLFSGIIAVYYDIKLTAVESKEPNMFSVLHKTVFSNRNMSYWFINNILMQVAAFHLTVY